MMPAQSPAQCLTSRQRAWCRRMRRGPMDQEGTGPFRRSSILRIWAYGTDNAAEFRSSWLITSKMKQHPNTRERRLQLSFCENSAL